MDANRDEALKCMKIAQLQFRQGNFGQCKKFLIKATKLDPTLDISEFASLFNENPNRSRHTSPVHERKHSQEGKRRTSPLKKDGPKIFQKTENDPIRQILKTKDHYEVLGIQKSASVDDIKKAYKLLARKYHPDKNQAPGATEAFKKIGTALNILTDPAKRKRYDMFGNEEETSNNVSRRRGDVFYQYEAHQGFDADVFNMFFNGGFPFAQFNHGARQHRNRQANNEESERELLPLVILFGISLFSTIIVKEPYFSLQKTNKYPLERFTKSYGVPYFIKTSFLQDFDGSLPQLEKQIEEEYVTNLRFRCYREKDAKEILMYHARYTNDEDAFYKAQRTPVPSCDRLNDMYQQGG